MSYEIGVLDYRSTSTFGDPDADPRVEHESLATVRVFTEGALLAEWVDQALDHQRDLWDVARLVWCGADGPTVDPRNFILPEGSYLRP